MKAESRLFIASSGLSDYSLGCESHYEISLMLMFYIRVSRYQFEMKYTYFISNWHLISLLYFYRC